MNCQEGFPADLCLKCSICNTVCPVYAVEDSFAGPKYIGPELDRLSKGKTLDISTITYCTGCRQCELVCPAGVKIAFLAQKTKERLAAEKGISFRDKLLGHNQLVSSVASHSAPLTNFMLTSAIVRGIAEKTLGIKNRPFPMYSWPFRYGGDKQPIAKAKAKVAYFVGCYGKYIGTGIPEAVVKVLHACSIEVIVPPQKCCGIPLLSNGLAAEARANALYNLKSLAEFTEQGYDVITSCPSCALSLKEEYAEHLNLPEASQVAAKVYDIAEYLLKINTEVGLGVEFKPAAERYFYHQPCHTKVQGIGNPSLELLKLIHEGKVETREQKCCGQAGTYGFKKEKYPISMAIGKSLFKEVSEWEADAVITECGMCSLQLAQGTGKKVCHPMEVLGAALKVTERASRDAL